MEQTEPRYALGHRSLGDAATERLRGLILSGELQAGEHLVETDLAELMGVSRGPVREALVRLEQEGFVDLVPRQGAFVVELTPELVQEKYELRRLLETYALRRGMAQLGDSDLDALERSCDEMEQAVALHDIQGFYETQYRYHRAIVSLARMGMLLKVWDLLGASIGSLMMLNLYHGVNGADYGPESWRSGVATGTLTAHRALTEVIRQGDRDRAVSELTEHLSRGELSVLQALGRARERWHRAEWTGVAVDSQSQGGG